MVPDLTQRFLGSTFDPKANSLNALRLALALLVLVAHSAELGGYGRDLQPLGAWAVAGFFCISGYLITASRDHSRSLGEFLWRRFLRIYPAFLAVLVVVAFAIAPAAGALAGAGAWAPASAVSYVVSNMGVWIFQLDIGEMLGSTPFPGVWNGSLWTLGYEALCYLVIGAVFLLTRSTRRVTVALLFVSSSAVAVLAGEGIATVPTTAATFCSLSSYFLAGAILYLWRDRIPLRRSGTLIACVLVVALAAGDHFPGLAGLPVAYLLMSLGIRLPLARIGARNDVSYGVYIYAFPVQQVLASLFAGSALPLWAFIILSLAFTMPLAWASWFFVERPALRAKNLFTRGTTLSRRRPDAVTRRSIENPPDAGLA